jgi:hypothetical protein
VRADPSTTKIAILAMLLIGDLPLEDAVSRASSERAVITDAYLQNQYS